MMAPAVGLPGLLVELLGQAEVGDLGPARLVEQDVGWLEVPVQDVSVVGRLHGSGQHLDQAGRLVRRQRRAVELFVQRNDRRGRNSRLKKGRPVVRTPDLVDVDDVGVRFQPGDGLGLGAESHARSSGVALAPALIIFRATTRLASTCQAL